MVTFLYRWRIKAGFEPQFIESWSAITQHYRENAGSCGSRLHRGSDGLWYGYAQWPSLGARAAAFDTQFEHPARAKLTESIEESLPEVSLEIESDLLGAIAPIET